MWRVGWHEGCRPPLPCLGVTLDFPRLKHHNVIESNRNPAHHYHTMGQAVPSRPLGRWGQKNTTTAQLALQPQRITSTKPTQDKVEISPQRREFSQCKKVVGGEWKAARRPLTSDRLRKNSSVTYLSSHWLWIWLTTACCSGRSVSGWSKLDSKVATLRCK